MANKKKAFPIVGVGASAGGLEALQLLLKGLTADPGVALVFIMHLAPKHKSMMVELLARSTKMPVYEAKNGMPFKINCVYVIQPNTNIAIANEKIKITKLKGTDLRHMPVDIFLKSLAEAKGNSAIGVILSGTATDGTLGAEAIKAEGGIVFAQDEKSSGYSGMPQSAINAGCVDFILPPDKIAKELMRIAKHPYVLKSEVIEPGEKIVESKGLGAIFEILHTSTGVDFNYYKVPTINRRISRRMVLLKLKKLDDYVKYLRKNKDEIIELYEDLLINVTSFFRDPKVFSALEKTILSGILKNRNKKQPIRIWIPGCSSGEEAYSYAICLLELLGDKANAVPVQIFASDISDVSISKARQGVYNKNIEKDVSPGRLSRFFNKSGSFYKVSKNLREMCVFSKQNVFRDPPFSNIDIISCRNLLIYLKPDAQKHIFQKFHYALKPSGFLVLGPSEATGGYPHLFNEVDRKNKIFSRKQVVSVPEMKYRSRYMPLKSLDIQKAEKLGITKESDISDIVDRTILGEFTPPGVLINSDMDVVQFRGRTSNYLESAAGKPSLNIFKLVKEDLRVELHAAIYKAKKTKRPFKKIAVELKTNRTKQLVNITVIPIKSSPLGEEMFLVLFAQSDKDLLLKEKQKQGSKKNTQGKSAKDSQYLNRLEKEYAATKEYLESVIEEHEHANEEIKSANEELMSGNEELQSTNEELETSKEELQSSNEELLTVNEELQNRNEEVLHLNDDITNLLNSVRLPTIMVGTDLIIRRLTPQAEKVLDLGPSDIGRSLTKTKLKIDVPELDKMILDVIETLNQKIVEIEAKEGTWYSVNIKPYRTSDNKINGAVVVFIDITTSKHLEKQLETTKKNFLALAEESPNGILVGRITDGHLKFLYANKYAEMLFGLKNDEILSEKVNFMDFIHPDYRKVVASNLELHKQGQETPAIEICFLTRGNNTIYSLVQSKIIEFDNQPAIIWILTNMTRQHQKEQELKESELKFRNLAEQSPNMIFINKMGPVAFANQKCEEITGYTSDELCSPDFNFLSLIAPEHLDVIKANFEKHKRGENVEPYEYALINKKNKRIDVIITTSLINYEETKAILGIVTDITERKRIEKEKKELEEIKNISKLKSDFLSNMSHELRTPLNAIIGFSEILYDRTFGPLNEKQADYLKDVLESSKHLMSLISELLDLTKIEAGKMTLEISKLPIKEVLESSLIFIREKARKNNIEVSCDIAGDVGDIEADERKVKQVLFNLLTNAIKFTLDGGKILLKAGIAGPNMEIAVIDNGIGIAKDNQQKMFNEFVQIANPLKKNIEGTGLGLALTKKIVELHGGKIWVESEGEGKGTTFRFTLPVK